jgi:hypothetical protein
MRGSRSLPDGSMTAGFAVACLAAVLAMGPLASAAAQTAAQDAHALAETFAQDSAAAEKRAARDALADNVEARKRAAEEHTQDTLRQAAEARRKAAEAKRRADAARRAATQLRIDEADMLARARAEAEERAAEERALQAEIERADADRSVAEARLAAERLDANRTAEEREAAEERLIEAAKSADAARKAMEEARETESRRIAEKLRLAQERRAAAEAARAAGPALPGAPAPAAPAVPRVEPNPETTTASTPPPIAVAPAASPPTTLPPVETAAALPRPPAAEAPMARGAPVTTVTVLILMQPGNRGIRRTNKSADPVLCIAESCYISKGPDADARRVNRWQALDTVNTLGKRAGACNNNLGCVFRNVDLGGAGKAMLQPVDLRLMHHDRRDTREAMADPTCEILDGRLSCGAGIKASDYRLWVVPESVARKAGGQRLESAIRDGLPDGRRVELQTR